MTGNVDVVTKEIPTRQSGRAHDQTNGTLIAVEFLGELQFSAQRGYGEASGRESYPSPLLTRRRGGVSYLPRVQGAGRQPDK